MRLEENLRFAILLGQEEDNPVLILKQPTPQQIKNFLQQRFFRKGNKVEDNSIEAREKFINLLLEKVKNVEIKDSSGNYVSIMTLPDWKDRIPLNWKTSLAIKFEEAETISEDEAGESLASSAS